MKQMNQGEQLIIDRFKSNIEQDANNIALFVGRPRIGKSLATCRIGECMNPKPFITLDPKEALIVGQKQKSGDIMIGDDWGASLGARDASMILNRVISQFIESFGYLNTTLLISVPDINMIDINVRRLIHLIFEVVYIDYEREKSLAWLWTYDTDPVSGIAEKKHPTYWFPNGPMILQGIGIERPSPDLERLYKQIKDRQIKQRWSELEQRIAKSKSKL